MRGDGGDTGTAGTRDGGDTGRQGHGDSRDTGTAGIWGRQGHGDGGDTGTTGTRDSGDTGQRGHGTAGLAELSPVSDRSMASAGPHDWPLNVISFS